VSDSSFDPDTGVLTSQTMACTVFIPDALAASVDTTIQLDKGGGPGSGSSTLTVDTEDPFDCVDGETSVGILTLTLLPQSHDEDQDGCTDWEELGESETAGGLRDPFNFWDFFDTPDGNNVRDRALVSTDISRVIARFGSTGDPDTDPLSPPPPAPAYHPAFDRGSSLGPGTWNLNMADGAITGGDTSAVIAQFGHSCVAAP
jgi:hypothetical protein